MEKRRRRFFRRTLYVLLLLTIIYGIWQLHSAIVLHTAYTQLLEQEGRPMMIDEVMPQYVSDGRTPPLYLAAAAILESESLKEAYQITETCPEYLCRLTARTTLHTIMLVRYIDFGFRYLTELKAIRLSLESDMPTEPFLYSKSHSMLINPPEMNLLHGSGSIIPPTGTFYGKPNETYIYWSNLLRKPYTTYPGDLFEDIANLSYDFIKGRLEKDKSRIFYNLIANDTVLDALKLVEEGTKNPDVVSILTTKKDHL